MSHTLDVLKYLREGAMVITPNNRLSQQILASYNTQYRSEKGLIARPSCFPYSVFLQTLFQCAKHQRPYENHPILLSTQQTHYLWQKILIQHHGAISKGLLNTVLSAWEHCHAWGISEHDVSFNDGLYTKQFQKWFQEYQKALKARHAITLPQIPNYFMEKSFSIAPTSLIWTCFDEFTPIQQSFQNYLQEHQCVSYFNDFKPKITSTYCYPAKDQSDEYQQLLIWINARLNQGDQHIAIVVPELQKEAPTLQRLFEPFFSSEDYNISYGKPLNEFPVVSTALQWLTLDLKYIQAQQIRLLLQSPFIAHGQQEFVARSQLLQDNILMRASHMSWHEFLSHIEAKTPKLHEILQKLPAYPETDAPDAWAQHFRERLEIIGFPGDGPILSPLYQCLQRFILLLDEFMSLTIISPQMQMNEAIKAIVELSQNIIFQIQKPVSAINVLGMLEGSGCRFDSIWITGLTDQSFPQKTKFSPLIPIELQKALSMPRTCMQHEFNRAQTVINRFSYACDHIVYSYPKMLADQPQLPSFLIKHLPHLPPIHLKQPQPKIALEPYEETYLHPPKHMERLSGGTSFLSQQAKCPFQAFANHRLKIRPLPEKTDGMDLMERGQLLHHALELLWRKLNTQSNLLSLSHDALENLLNISITEAFTYFHQKRISILPLIEQVEFQRIARLIYASLEWEKQRPPFVVESLENQYHITLASIPFKVRIDRLDRTLVSASKIVIDYKTSLPSPLPWSEERPEAPQLLLYALLDTDIHTLLFMQLKAGRMNLSGFSAHMNEKGITTLKKGETWSQYQTYWQQQLENLAEEIKQGYCAPIPKKISICQQCANQALCRTENS